MFHDRMYLFLLTGNSPANLIKTSLFKLYCEEEIVNNGFRTLNWQAWKFVACPFLHRTDLGTTLVGKYHFRGWYYGLRELYVKNCCFSWKYRELFDVRRKCWQRSSSLQRSRRIGLMYISCEGSGRKRLRNRWMSFSALKHSTFVPMWIQWSRNHFCLRHFFHIQMDFEPNIEAISSEKFFESERDLMFDMLW